MSHPEFGNFPNMKRPSIHPKFMATCGVLLAAVFFSITAVPAADEFCASCGQQVSGSGNFSHHKDRPSLMIDGAGENVAAFREDVSGTNFTVTISHLPAGK